MSINTNPTSWPSHVFPFSNLGWSSESSPQSGFVKYASRDSVGDSCDPNKHVTFRVRLAPKSLGVAALAIEEMPPPSKRRKAKDESPPAESKRGTKRSWWSLGWGSGDENAREKKRARRSKAEEEVYSGLENQRNTCYLNSMLQCLYHVKGKPTFSFEEYHNIFDGSVVVA